ncbi:MAG: hypothetical protein K2Q14_00025 [Gammaproteobacteria bacterium]|nr:hypothetical protein [Gammaproteobacteria bacterium]
MPKKNNLAASNIAQKRKAEVIDNNNLMTIKPESFYRLSQMLKKNSTFPSSNNTQQGNLPKKNNLAASNIAQKRKAEVINNNSITIKEVKKPKYDYQDDSLICFSTDSDSDFDPKIDSDNDSFDSDFSSSSPSRK